MISIDDFKKVEIAIGKIESAETIEGSDKLLKLSVDFGLKQSAPADHSPEHSFTENVGGEERDTRTVVSGIRKHFENPQDLVGMKCAFAINLEPRPLMGIPSEAMILAVSTDDVFSVLRVVEGIPPGTRVK